MRLYQTKARTTEAFEFIDAKESAEDVVAFGGTITHAGLAVFNSGPNLTYARPGDMVLRGPGGVAVMHKGEFNARFDKLLQV